MKKKKLAFLTGIVAIAGAVILVYKKVKKRLPPNQRKAMMRAVIRLTMKKIYQFLKMKYRRYT